MDRDAAIKQFSKYHFDALVVGGGNSGASIAACLAASNHKGIALIDRNDFASGTSQHSSNLIWGGIKYLENGEFSLVRKLCRSRNELIKKFPGLVDEIRFYCPHERTAKHSLIKLVLGTWFYWLWGNFFTRKPKRYPLSSLKGFDAIPIKPDNLDGIFEYSDAYLPENDARFVFHFIKSAHRHGAVVANYVELQSAVFHSNTKGNRVGNKKKSGTKTIADGSYWELKLYDRIAKKHIVATTSVLINAAGGYVDILNEKNHIDTEHIHCFSKGVHIIVNKLFADPNGEPKVLTFFSNDDRLFFAIPMGPCTCIGTTDTMVDKPEVDITDEDITFILENINRLLKFDKPLSKKDIISTRSGVRPLVIAKPKEKGGGKGGNGKSTVAPEGKWFNISRKHVIESNEKNYLSIFGGKLTDCINIAEEARISVLNMLKDQTRSDTNVGAMEWVPDLRVKQEKFLREFRVLVESEQKKTKTKSKIEEISQFWGKRLWRRYTTDVYQVIDEIKTVKPFLKEFIPGSGYLEGEIHYQLKNEMIMFEEDLLRRRSMLALIVKKENLTKKTLIKKLPKKMHKNKNNVKIK